VTRHLTNGQMFWIFAFTLSGLYMAGDMVWRRIKARRSARRPPFDWWTQCPSLRQPSHVHRTTRRGGVDGDRPPIVGRP
jgi:hypothetical protein